MKIHEKQAALRASEFVNVAFGISDGHVRTRRAKVIDVQRAAVEVEYEDGTRKIVAFKDIDFESTVAATKKTRRAQERDNKHAEVQVTKVRSIMDAHTRKFSTVAQDVEEALGVQAQVVNGPPPSTLPALSWVQVPNAATAGAPFGEMLRETVTRSMAPVPAPQPAPVAAAPAPAPKATDDFFALLEMSREVDEQLAGEEAAIMRGLRELDAQRAILEKEKNRLRAEHARVTSKRELLKPMLRSKAQP